MELRRNVFIYVFAIGWRFYIDGHNVFLHVISLSNLRTKKILSIVTRKAIELKQLRYLVKNDTTTLKGEVTGMVLCKSKVRTKK